MTDRVNPRTSGRILAPRRRPTRVSNAMSCAGASRIDAGRSDARRALKDHPTVKPTAMLEDALLASPIAATSSSTHSSVRVQTLMASEKTNRICRSVEIDPLHVAVIVRRFEVATSNPAKPSSRWRPAGQGKQRPSRARRV